MPNAIPQARGSLSRSGAIQKILIGIPIIATTEKIVPNTSSTFKSLRLLIFLTSTFIITPKIFEILEETKPGKGNEIQLTDALLQLVKEEAMYAYDFEGRRYDVGDKLGFLQATVEYALRKPELRDGFMEYLKTIVE